MVFPVVMYGCESWAIKNTECPGIDAFELWCWNRFLRVSWTWRRSNQPNLEEISLNIHWKDCCWSWNSKTLATWCEKPTLWKKPWCCKRLKARAEGDLRGWDVCMASLTQWTWVWASSERWWRARKSGKLQSVRLQRVRQDWDKTAKIS